jgi:hypothetical protein
MIERVVPEPRLDIAPLATLKPFDARTIMSKGAVSYLHALYWTIAHARHQVPPCPHESDVVEDGLLISDLDHAIRCIRSIALALGVELEDE